MCSKQGKRETLWHQESPKCTGRTGGWGVKNPRLARSVVPFLASTSGAGRLRKRQAVAGV